VEDNVDLMTGSMDEEAVMGEEELDTPSLEEEMEEDVKEHLQETEGPPEISDDMSMNEPPTL
jgi:hypothetical protein